MLVFTSMTKCVLDQRFLNIVLIFTMLSFTMTVNAASSSVARTKCSSVEQEIVDFEILEKEIRNTKAIGGLSKLKLSGDINKMVADLKTYHAGDSSLTLEQHREQYDLLYMKVVSQVQDKDPELLQDEDNLKKISQVRMMESETVAGIIDALTSVLNTVVPSAHADEVLTHDEVVKRDLLVVVAAQGVVCTAVTVYKKITNHDYVATCEGGDKYRVNVSDDGRVNVAPHKL